MFCIIKFSLSKGRRGVEVPEPSIVGSIWTEYSGIEQQPTKAGHGKGRARQPVQDFPQNLPKCFLPVGRKQLFQFSNFDSLERGLNHCVSPHSFLPRVNCIRRSHWFNLCPHGMAQLLSWDNFTILFSFHWIVNFFTTSEWANLGEISLH